MLFVSGERNHSLPKVEYLICGDDAKVVPKEYSRFHPFRSILEDLSVLSDDSIEKLQIMIHALAENKK